MQSSAGLSGIVAGSNGPSLGAEGKQKKDYSHLKGMAEKVFGWPPSAFAAEIAAMEAAGEPFPEVDSGPSGVSSSEEEEEDVG